MVDFDPSTHPHRRFNPLTNEHVLVSPHRTKRPWQGQTEPPQTTKLPDYDPNCYLCPGNSRAGGQKNETYTSTTVFENDFAAVLPGPAPAPPSAPHPLLSTEPVSGGCDVLIFHPRHDLTLARLEAKDILLIIEEWTRVYVGRGAQEGIEYVQIFENKGAMMGCSNPHPHGQVWSLSAIPTLPAMELANLKKYSVSDVAPSSAPKGPEGRPCLLCDYANFEVGVAEDEGRVVAKNEHWVALVPWWATWPFEVLSMLASSQPVFYAERHFHPVLPYRRHVPSLLHLTAEENASFAQIISRLTKRYDNLFQCSFAYSMGIHQRPVPPSGVTLESLAEFDGVSSNGEQDIAHLHLHFSPPLLRSASVRKFLVGFEMMGEPQRDLTPEQAAARLRACSEVHYLDAHADGVSES
ncbi:galactose-1-phosphate uridylyltransferase [Punctularia strigosozonata HHB-11173 SS5]|uniref:galactose-1-phosphate uridylyltransferase n=1 Tax=Punctularia strigosozonata (strain HHB-11173) TaxID=741275 RepID=UPI00044164BD|nr:galactose-1-phosphate uridylyltransferase [Punctularia strigosozonata HHB-11173 SS5]EIN07631.1 galactose-1-phosphate uridylyltransferase [Punctularia strigosozonata HHB-11173 SS5]